MDPSSATKATLKVLGLCTVLLLLVASATISVAVMVWHSEAARQLKGCQERAANESAALANRLAELEQARIEQGKQVARLAQREKELQQQLSQTQEGRKRLEDTLRGCRENLPYVEESQAEKPEILKTLSDASILALRHEMMTLQAEGTEMGSQNGALLAEVAEWKAQLARLERQLEEAERAQVAAETQKDQCQARQEALQETLHSYQAEMASLQRRLSARSSAHRRKG